MNRILATVLALSLSGGAAVMAQPNNRDNNDRDDRVQNDNSYDDRDQNNNNDDNHGRRDSDNGRDERAGNQDRHNDDGDGQRGNQRWSRGDRVPDRYRQNQYVVSDWQQHGLRQPGRGYRWVRNDNNDFFLASNQTGVIVTVVYRDQRDQRWDQRYARSYTYNDDIFYKECRHGPDPAGVIAGALIGGLFGNAVGNRDNRTGTTIAGVVVGGAVGAALTSNLNCEDRSYAYKSYYDGFNSGHPNSRYQWRNPRNNDRGDFRVGKYYNDRDGFRCANFTQTVYFHGRQQTSRGLACRQPNGAWAIVG
jgi:Ni/Co efflux regulator RcnB/surface antigen